MGSLGLVRATIIGLSLLPLVLAPVSGTVFHGMRWLELPARIALAVSPFVFGLVIDKLGLAAMWLSAALGASVFGALLALRRS